EPGRHARGKLVSHTRSILPFSSPEQQRSNNGAKTGIPGRIDPSGSEALVAAGHWAIRSAHMRGRAFVPIALFVVLTMPGGPCIAGELADELADGPAGSGGEVVSAGARPGAPSAFHLSGYVDVGFSEADNRGRG